MNRKILTQEELEKVIILAEKVTGTTIRSEKGVNIKRSAKSSKISVIYFIRFYVFRSKNDPIITFDIGSCDSSSQFLVWFLIKYSECIKQEMAEE